MKLFVSAIDCIIKIEDQILASCKLKDYLSSITVLQLNM